jgi:hypothetical protein
MHSRTRSLTWHGQAFRFQCLTIADRDSDAPLWAVSRNGEFIGTMACSTEVPTKDFDLRGLTWLGDLLGASERANHTS